MVDAEALKRDAGIAAAALVEDGMKVGLGTGSTVHHTIVELGRRVTEEGLTIVGVPTSERSDALARSVGITLVALDDLEGGLDLTIDGADEFDEDLHLIKGGGGALLREKIVAQASRRMVVVADDRKRVNRLGDFPLPIEVVPFAHQTTERRLAALLAEHLGADPAAAAVPLFLRRGDDSTPYVTDNGNHILDAHLGPSIRDPAGLEAAIRGITGVVEVGLFVGMCERVILAGAAGLETIMPR